MIDRVKELAANYSDEVVAIRRHLHQHPELSFVEFETSKYIQSKLDEWGITYEAGMVKTGIVVLVEGNNPSKKVIALRADIDALPIQEENNFLIDR